MANKSYSFERLTKQLQKDLSSIILQYTKDLFPGKMISISEVRLTADKGIAKVYISVFPSEFGKDVVDYLMTQKSPIRFELGNRIRNQVRHIPSLQFYIDKTFDELEKIDKLLAEDTHLNDDEQTNTNDDEQKDKK